MPTLATRTRYAVLLPLAALVTVVSCGRQLQRLVAVNQPPDVRIVSSEAVSPTAGAGTAQVIVRWRGSDPDGRIDHYLVSVNPRSLDAPDASWQRTTATAWLASGKPGEPLIVAIRAVDAGGAQSTTASRSMVDGNVAPSVQITVPHPSPLIMAGLKPGQTVHWEGFDPDGPKTQPAGYKFKFFFGDASPFPVDLIRLDPDSLRRAYAPAYEGWESVDARTTSAIVPDGPMEAGAFVVVAVDAQGATTAPFSMSTNVLGIHRFDPAAALGPRITVFNASFNYTTLGGVPPAMPPTVERTIDVAGDLPVTLNWFAEPAVGLDLGGYRWGLDLTDVLDDHGSGVDDHGAGDPAGSGMGHWSQWSLRTTSVTVGPFHGPAAAEEHVVSIEARDQLGEISLIAVRLRPIVAPRDHPLLIVDDTRFRPDRLRLGVLEPPIGAWPTAAELDTFLFARGGVPWEGYPPGTLSSPGLFARYDFDTLGTRTGQADLTVPLETLLHYQNVVWITDAVGATFNRLGTDGNQPQTALRYMTAPGRTNTLAEYVDNGGRLWILGGGAGYASTINWNLPFNDTPTVRFSSATGELAPGRFMWDVVHWRSEFRVASAPPIALARVAPPRAEFARLPASLDLKTPATDPLPPLRNPGDFYRTLVPLETLTLPNSIVEGRGHRGLGGDFSVEDTLYQVSSIVDPSPVPLITYYRGSENGATLFGGTDLWSYRRSQCQQMVDAVLQDLWHVAPAMVAEPLRRGHPALGATGNPTRAPRPAATAARSRMR